MIIILRLNLPDAGRMSSWDQVPEVTSIRSSGKRREAQRVKPRSRSKRRTPDRRGPGVADPSCPAVDLGEDDVPPHWFYPKGAGQLYVTHSEVL